MLFSTADLLVAGLLSHLLRATGASPRLRAIATAAWLFNPYTATISTRGSCDVLSVLLLLGLLVMLLHGADVAAGALYGLAVHFRIYPVIYGPAIVLFLLRRAAVRQGLVRLRPGNASSSSSSSSSSTGGGGRGSLRQWAGAVRPAAAFCLAAAATFAVLGAAFYYLYGNAFLNEAFLHHLGRKDPRHNFSPYYYPIYLQGYAAAAPGSSSSSSAAGLAAGGDGATSMPPPPPRPGQDGAATAAAAAVELAARLLQPLWGLMERLLPLQEPWRLAAAPQAVALMALSAAYHADLPSAWLLQVGVWQGAPVWACARACVCRVCACIYVCICVCVCVCVCACGVISCARVHERMRCWHAPRAEGTTHQGKASAKEERGSAQCTHQPHPPTHPLPPSFIGSSDLGLRDPEQGGHGAVLCVVPVPAAAGAAGPGGADGRARGGAGRRRRGVGGGAAALAGLGVPAGDEGGTASCREEEEEREAGMGDDTG